MMSADVIREREAAESSRISLRTRKVSSEMILLAGGARSISSTAGPLARSIRPMSGANRYFKSWRRLNALRANQSASRLCRDGLAIPRS